MTPKLSDASHEPHEPRTRGVPAPPLWVFLGGVLLASAAGFVNAVVLQQGLLPVTHLTGSVSHASGDLAQGNVRKALELLGIIAMFISGAACSGVFVGDSRLRHGRYYGLILLIEAMLLTAAGLLMASSAIAGMLLASLSAGMQNGMASSYRGLIVRTTHITGTATDLGLWIGALIARRPHDAWRFWLLLTVFASFAAAGVLGWLASESLDGVALLIPAMTLALAGLVFRRRPPIVSDHAHHRDTGRG